MFGVILAFTLPFLLAACVRLLQPSVRDQRLFPILMAGYATRLVATTFVHKVDIFSYGSGGDAQLYEVQAEAIARLWEYTGVHYVSGSEVLELSDTSLPQNLFAVIDYVNGEATRLGCGAFIAAVACMTCLNMYSIATELGARRSVALAIMSFVLFMPSYILFTSDTYKDGLVIFFELAILACALRLSRKFSFGPLITGIVCLLALWGTRFYVVYVMTVPLVIGTIGLRGRSLSRLALTGGILAIVGIVIIVLTKGAATITEHANAAFETGTAAGGLAENGAAGSGVMFDNSTPYASFGPKLLYTLLSPFPWQSGSTAMQIAKFEVLGWYFILYRALRATPELWRTRRSELLLFATFVLPLFLAYTLGFSNVGLVLRERLGAVIGVSLLASTSWGLGAAPAGDALATALPLHEGANR